MKGGIYMNQVNNQNADYDKEEMLKKMESMINNPPPEVLARFGGIEGWKKELRRQKRRSKMINIKVSVKIAFEKILKFAGRICYILLIIYLITYFFL